MLNGQAVGVLAAISVKEKVQPRKIKSVKVQKTLVEAKTRISLREYPDVRIDNIY